MWAGVTSFQIRELVKRENSNFTVKKLSIYYLNRAIKVSIASAKSCRWYMPPDMMWWKVYLTCVAFLPKPITLVYSRGKHQTNPEWVWNAWLIFPKTVKVMSNKEKLRNWHTSKETEETWCLDAVWCLGLDPGTEKVHKWKYWWNTNVVRSLVNSKVPMLVSQL